MKLLRTLAFICICGAVAVNCEDKKTEAKSKGKLSVVYSYSTVTTTDDGEPKMSQLTIGRGQDGKYHFVRVEDGKKKEGIWEGPLPSTPDISDIAGAPKDFTPTIDPELVNLSTEIHSSIQYYIKKALGSLNL